MPLPVGTHDGTAPGMILVSQGIDARCSFDLPRLSSTADGHFFPCLRVDLAFPSFIQVMFFMSRFDSDCNGEPLAFAFCADSISHVKEEEVN